MCAFHNTGQQSTIPSFFTTDPPSPFNGTDGSPSSFGSSCVEESSSYQCTNNSDNPLFDCSADSNSYYGWNTNELQSNVTIMTGFADYFQSVNILMTFLVSTLSNVSTPAALRYKGYNIEEAFAVITKITLPTDLPEGPYQHNFTLSSVSTPLNEIFIDIIPNTTFQWVAIGRIILCVSRSVNEGL